METCHQPNSRMPIPDKPIKNLRQVNTMLKQLGLFPLRNKPTTKTIIKFFKKKVTVIIQPVTIWLDDSEEVPDYKRMRMITVDALIPDTKHMQITIINHEK